MKIRRRIRYDGDRYPTLQQPLDRRKVLAGLGGLAGLAMASTTAGGCMSFPGGGDIQGIVDGGDIWTVNLPEEPAVQTLHFGSHAYVDYYVVVQVDYYDLVDAIVADRAQLLVAIDEILRNHPIHAYAPGEPTHPMQQEIWDMLEDIYQVEQEIPGQIVSVQLVVVEYDEGQEIDGDIDTGV